VTRRAAGLRPGETPTPNRTTPAFGSHYVDSEPHDAGAESRHVDSEPHDAGAESRHVDSESHDADTESRDAAEPADFIINV